MDIFIYKPCIKCTFSLVFMSLFLLYTTLSFNDNNSEEKSKGLLKLKLNNHLIFRYCTKLYSHLAKEIPDVALSEHLKSETGY